MTQEQANDLLRQTCESLGEHFESLRIFGTWHEEGATKSITYGGGNYYAQCGSIREWQIVQDEMTRNEARNRGEAS
jgi:hypothetical protein